MPRHGGTLLSIQYLRGLAATSVVMFHTKMTGSMVGAAGVDVFFVISGFVMAHVGERATSPSAFLAARAWRVAPLYWLVTLAAYFGTPGTDRSRLASSLLFWPHANHGGRDYPILLQGWTLNYEAFFYVAFAACLLIPVRRRLPTMSIGFAALALAGLALRPTPIALATYTNGLLLEFVAGAWLCKAWQAGWCRRMPAALMLPLGLAAFAAQVARGEPETWRAVTWGLPALLVVAGALGMEARGWLPRLPALAALGDASYAIYLTHMLTEHGLSNWMAGLSDGTAIMLMTAASVLVGFAAHHLAELPLSRLRRNPLATLAATRPGQVR